MRIDHLVEKEKRLCEKNTDHRNLSLENDCLKIVVTKMKADCAKLKSLVKKLQEDIGFYIDLKEKFVINQNNFLLNNSREVLHAIQIEIRTTDLVPKTLKNKHGCVTEESPEWFQVKLYDFGVMESVWVPQNHVIIVV